VCTKN
jgi:hypothetical protein